MLYTATFAMQLPSAPTLSIGSDSSDDDDGDHVAQLPAAASAAPPLVGKHDFLLSQSGAFKVADFQLRSEGGLVVTDRGDTPLHADQGTDGMTGTPALKVQSLSDLEVLEELGSGASGTVFKARHVSSGTIVAVKCVTILEKSKRDQVVSELRIMMGHARGNQSLVHMHK